LAPTPLFRGRIDAHPQLRLVQDNLLRRSASPCLISIFTAHGVQTAACLDSQPRPAVRARSHARRSSPWVSRHRRQGLGPRSHRNSSALEPDRPAQVSKPDRCAHGTHPVERVSGAMRRTAWLGPAHAQAARGLRGDARAGVARSGACEPARATRPTRSTPRLAGRPERHFGNQSASFRTLSPMASSREPVHQASA
jgi:hypothetical protein